MTEKRMQGFTFYGSYYDSIAAIKEDEDLTEEVKNKRIADLCLGIFEYMFLDKEPELKGSAKGTYLAIKPNLDSSITKFESGKKGGANTKQTTNEPQADDKQDESEAQANGKQSESEPQAKAKQTASKTKTNNLLVNYLNNNNNNTREDVANSIRNRYQEFFDYQGQTKYGVTANEVVNVMADAWLCAKSAEGLKFRKKTFFAAEFAEILQSIDTGQFYKIVVSVDQELRKYQGADEIKNRSGYILGIIFNLAKQEVQSG